MGVEDQPQVREYRIQELAQHAGTTVRNVRAYRERGLLPVPRRQGRVALYTDRHLGRLRLIGQLLDRGYTLANISELLDAWESGNDMAEALGLEAAIALPWSDESATVMTLGELAEMFQGPIDLDLLAQAQDLGLITPLDDTPLVGSGPDGSVPNDVLDRRYRVDSLRELGAGAELVAAGIPLDAVMANGLRVHELIDEVARLFVELTTTHLFDPLGELPGPDELARLAPVVQRLRPLAERVVDAELARAMARQVQARLAERLGHIVTSTDATAVS